MQFATIANKFISMMKGRKLKKKKNDRKGKQEKKRAVT